MNFCHISFWDANDPTKHNRLSSERFVISKTYSQIS